MNEETVYQFSYDKYNRLNKVTHQGQGEIRYRYDIKGNRILKEVFKEKDDND